MKAWLPPLGFAVQTWLSAVLALGIAFELQMDAPFWAAIAAVIVSQPAPGMAFSKGVYRLVGSVIGAAMGLVFIALFAQTPGLFIFMLGLWLGLCTLLSNLLRNFRAYGAVLAGYTTAIVSLDTYSQPDNAFTIAIARASCTVIGILCAMAVTMLLAPHRASGQTMTGLRGVLTLVARRVSLPVDVSHDDRIAVGTKAVQNLIALDAPIDFAAAEDPSFRIHAERARCILVHLFEALSARRSLEARWLRSREELGPDLDQLLADAMSAFHAVSDQSTPEQLHAISANLEALIDQAGKSSAAPPGEVDDVAVSRRLVLDRLTDLMVHYRTALEEWEKMHGPWTPHAHLYLNFHNDHRAALINGTRAFLAMVVAGWFWIESAWPDGGTMLTIVAVVCTLFSATPNPDKQGFAFFIGTLYAAVAGYIVEFVVLNHVEGFFPLALAMGIFIIPGGVLIYNPRTTALGFALAVNTITLIHPTNLMDYDISVFLNTTLAALVGVFIGSVAYQLFMPPDPRAARRYVIHRIRRGLEIIASRVPAPPHAAWQTRMYDRTARLYNRDNPSGTPTDAWFDHGLAALNVGNELLRIRGIADRDHSPTARRILNVFTTASSRPLDVGPVVQAARESLDHAAPPPDPALRDDFLRLKGAIEEIDFYMQNYGILTLPYGP